jgi:cation:H+ antiporter
MIIFSIFIFLGSCLALSLISKFLIKTLANLAELSQWREFVLSFLVMALAGSVPNLSVGVISALKKIPQLSLADTIGGNVVDLTLAIGLSILVARGISVDSRTVQTTCLFTMASALLPIILMADGSLGRLDGLLLILVFFFYLSWLFSKRERFTLERPLKQEQKNGRRLLIFNLLRLAAALVLLILVANFIVQKAIGLAQALNVPLFLIGIFVVGLGNALPETYFAVISARKGQTWMVLGDLMGAVIIPATLVLGTVALITPIVIDAFSPFLTGSLFLFLAAFFFLLAVRSGRRFSRKEAVGLLFLYLLFAIAELFPRILLSF